VTSSRDPIGYKVSQWTLYSYVLVDKLESDRIDDETSLLGYIILVIKNERESFRSVEVSIIVRSSPWTICPAFDGF
jgi:hypothetical protein